MKPASLSTRLLVWILPVSLAATGALSLSTYLIARRVILWQAQQAIAAVTQSAAAEVRAYFAQRHSDLATIAHSPLFKDHYMNVEYGLAEEAVVYRKEIERMLLDLSVRSKAYARLSYVDARGAEVSAIESDQIIRPGRPLDPAFAEQVARLPAGRDLVSPIVRLRAAPIVRYGVPLRDESGHLRGALVFSVSLAPVYQELDALRTGRTGKTYLSPRGQTVGETPNLLTSQAAVAGTPWSVVTAVDRRDFLAPLSWVNALTFLLMLLGTPALAWILIRKVREQLAPIASLADAAQTYAKGNLDARVAVTGPREVAALAESFNVMAVALKERARALVESEARYRSAVENSPNANIALDQNFRITLWNRRAEAFFGWQPTEAYGRALDFVLGKEAYERLKRQVETEGAVRQAEVQGTARDGRKLDLNVSWTGTSAAPGAAREWYIVIQDVTERKRLQAQLVQAEKMTALGNLTAGIAHELNNPLAAVTGFSELLIGELALEPHEREDMQHLYQSAMRCRDIVQGLLLYTRKVPSAPKRVALNYVVQSSVALFEYRLARVEGIDLEVELDSARPEVAGEFQKLQQVLVNLVANAHDALRGRLGRKVIRVRTKALTDGSEVSVEDNGSGVPADKRAAIFEPFFTTKAAGKGTGLGLPISLQIVGEFGGELRCEDALGGGARFVARFPSCPAGLPEPEAALKPPAAGKGGRILIVDDEPQLVSLMTRLLAEDGVTAVAATSAPEALSRLTRDSFDLVIADIDLGASRGTDLLHAMRGQPQRPAFVFTTGDILNVSLTEELAALDAPVLVKPFLRTEFLRVVRRILAARSGRLS